MSGPRDKDEGKIGTQHSRFFSPNDIYLLCAISLEPVIGQSERGVQFHEEGPTSCLVQHDYDTVRGRAERGCQYAAQGQGIKEAGIGWCARCTGNRVGQEYPSLATRQKVRHVF